MSTTITIPDEITLPELKTLLAVACPHLADHPELADVLFAADQAVKAYQPDGKVTFGEALAIAVPLLSHGALASHLSNFAETLAAGVLKRLQDAKESAQQAVGPALQSVVDHITGAFPGLPVSVSEPGAEHGTVTVTVHNPTAPPAPPPAAENTAPPSPSEPFVLTAPVPESTPDGGAAAPVKTSARKGSWSTPEATT